MDKTVYIYSIAQDGRVIERTGVITAKTDMCAVARAQDGHNVILARKAGEIRNNAMWSAVPMKYAYVEKMLDILVERRNHYQERLAATTRRIANIRAG